MGLINAMAKNTKYLIFTILLLTALTYSKGQNTHEEYFSVSRDGLHRFSSNETTLLDSIETEIRDKCIFPEIVIKQMKLETGSLTCTNCSWDHNNLFGFRWKGEYLEFDTWQDGVDYCAEWQKRKFTEDYYYTFLIEVGYATDPQYINKLKQL